LTQIFVESCVDFEVPYPEIPTLSLYSLNSYLDIIYSMYIIYV